MAKKRVILMYISEISGHRNAAFAIEKALKTLSPDIETLSINAFNYTNPISEKVVNSLYMAVIKRTPKIWDYLYDNPKVVKRLEKIKNTIHKFNSPKFQRLFDKFNPDAVVCTQAFPCGMVADYKNTYNSDLPLFAVLTDYAPHSYWLYDKVDFYITPSDEMNARLEKKGVEAKKLKPFGIPFDIKFNLPVNSAEVRQKMKLDPDLPVILIMGGGHGLGPIKTIIKSIDKVKNDLQLVIVTGSNRKLYSSLKRKIKKYCHKISLLAYVNNIHELMSVASIVITKPGGITISEALAKKLPMLIIKPIPGQEESNTIYLTEHNAAIKVNKPRHINIIIENLLDNPGKLKNISEAAARIAKPNASLDIAKLILSRINA